MAEITTEQIDAMNAGPALDADVGSAIGWQGKWGWSASHVGNAATASAYEEWNSREDAEASMPQVGSCKFGNPDVWTVKESCARPIGFYPSKDDGDAIKAFVRYGGGRIEGPLYSMGDEDNAEPQEIWHVRLADMQLLGDAFIEAGGDIDGDEFAANCFETYVEAPTLAVAVCRAILHSRLRIQKLKRNEVPHAG